MFFFFYEVGDFVPSWDEHFTKKCTLYVIFLIFSKQKRRGTSVRVISRRSCAEISVMRSNGEKNVN